MQVENSEEIVESTEEVQTSAKRPVEKDKLVTLSVKMADMSGEILEETGEEGIVYLHGHGDIFPKIEEALESRFEGEGFFIKLEPEDAFGEYDSDAIEMVPLEALGDPESIVPGLQFEDIPGRPSEGKIWHVTDVAGGFAVLETNHPYAGMALQFEIKVLKVEDPLGDETGTEDVVVPSFLKFADKIVDEDFDDEEEYDVVAAGYEDDGSSMAKLARTPRIVR